MLVAPFLLEISNQSPGTWDPLVWYPAFPSLGVIARQDIKVSNYQNLFYAGQPQVPRNLSGLLLRVRNIFLHLLVTLFHPLLYHRFSAQTFLLDWAIHRYRRAQAAN